MTNFKDLFTIAQLNDLNNHPLIGGERHPSWYPIFANQKREIDHLVDSATRSIYTQAGGRAWLQELLPRLIDFEDPSNSSSAIAELRTYGGLLEAGYNVCPIPRSSNTTPDFQIKLGGSEAIVEVFSKHQDKAEEQLSILAQNLESSSDEIQRQTIQTATRTINTSTFELAPGGKPDVTKPGDSIQANVISKICGIKQDESQFNLNKPIILVVDLCHFGGIAISSMFDYSESSPVRKGHSGLSSGSLWYAMYGWKGAPIFEEHSQVSMGHDGRFRLKDNKKTKISAVLFTLTDCSILFENPWADFKLPTNVLLAMRRYPWFNLENSICSWEIGLAEKIIETHVTLINAMHQNPIR